MSAEISLIDGMFGVDEILTPEQMFSRLEFVDYRSEAREAAVAFANNAYIDNQSIKIVTLTEDNFFLELSEQFPTEQ